jgi:hypothetical protein
MGYITIKSCNWKMVFQQLNSKGCLAKLATLNMFKHPDRFIFLFGSECIFIYVRYNVGNVKQTIQDHSLLGCEAVYFWPEDGGSRFFCNTVKGPVHSNLNCAV